MISVVKLLNYYLQLQSPALQITLTFAFYSIYFWTAEGGRPKVNTLTCEDDALHITRRNYESAENEFRILFPKQLPIIHKGRARTITFALNENSPQIYRHNLIGDH